MNKKSMIKYRYFGEEEIHQEKQSLALRFLYNTLIGRLILKIVTLKFVSKGMGVLLSSFISKPLIKKYIKRYSIDMDRFEKIKYKSFNDFFIRKLKNKEFQSKENEYIAIADSKISYYEITDDFMLNIKNSTYSLAELIQDEKIADEFKNGICLVYRLSPSNYHRYIFGDNGVQKHLKDIEGKLHTVNPIVYDKYKVFLENYRSVSELTTKNFGKIIQVEVGALCVGKIVNENKERYAKYEEKGHFEFGGSTIIQILQKDVIDIDSAIINNTSVGIETVVDICTVIGRKKSNTKVNKSEKQKVDLK